jgi:S1-C subfamily serine protease
VEGRRVRCKQCEGIFTAERIDGREVEVAPADAPTRSSTRSRTGEQPLGGSGADDKAANLPWIIGGVVACVGVLAVGAIAVAFILKPAAKDNQQLAARDSVPPPVPMPQPVLVPPVDTPPAPPPPQPAPAPTATAAVPPAAGKSPAKIDKLSTDAGPRTSGDGRMSPDARDKVKHATVFINVTYSNGRQASGSGFFGSPDKRNLILTNAHVVGMLAPESHAPKTVEVTLNSGEANMKKTTARVLGVDRHSDLAVLDVGTDVGMPAPLTVKPAAGLQELDPVYVFGFPLGKTLGDEITIRPSSVSSLRKHNGELDSIQVAGGMDRGNSGGPVTDSNGDVVGVAVSGVEGSSLLNFAIPGERVRRMLNGGVSSISIGMPFKDGRKVSLPVALDMIDPLNRIKTVGVDVWTGNDAGSPTADDKERPGDSPRRRADLNYSSGLARGNVALPDLPSGKVYWLQPVYVSGGDTYRGAAVMQDCRPEAAIERKPANLRLRSSSVSSRQVSIMLKSSLLLNAEDGSSATITHSADLLERASGDMLRLEYKRVKQDEIVRGKKGTGRPLDTIEANLHNMAVDLRLDSKGNPINPLARLDEKKLKSGLLTDQARRARAGTPPAQLGNLPEIANKLIEFATPLDQALELTAVPLPNEDGYAPGRSWTGLADRPVPIETPDELGAGQARLTYTYLGERQRQGKPEAVIDLDSVITGKNGSESVGGHLHGTASVDLATGIATRVEIKAVLDIEALVGGKTVRVIANVTIELTRTLPGT